MASLASVRQRTDAAPDCAHAASVNPIANNSRGSAMKRTTLTAVAASVGVAFAAYAAAETMSKTHYKSSKQAIESEYKSASAACEPLKANAKDICMAEARGKERV